MNEKEKRVRITKLHMKRAEEALGAAEHLKESGYYNDSLSRSYYSAMHAAKAVLNLLGENPKSHSRTISLFGLYLIEKEEIEKEYGKILGKLGSYRERSDYSVVHYLGEEEAEEAIELAKKFLTKIIEVVEKWQN